MGIDHLKVYQLMHSKLVVFLISIAFTIACPGSSAWIHHAKCSIDLEFQNDCNTVQAEILARANGQGGWYDPHNRGTYTVLQSSPEYVKIRRKTASIPAFTDLM